MKIFSISSKSYCGFVCIWTNWCSPGFLEFSIFFGVLLLVETVFPERTFYRVSDMRTLTIKILEQVWAWFALLGFKLRRVKFIISFTTPCKVMMIISKMQPIVFGIFWTLNTANPCHMPPFPTIFALRNVWVHVGTPHHSNNTSNIELPGLDDKA